MKLNIFKSDEVRQLLEEDDNFFQSHYDDDTNEKWNPSVNEAVNPLDVWENIHTLLANDSSKSEEIVLTITENIFCA